MFLISFLIPVRKRKPGNGVSSSCSKDISANSSTSCLVHADKGTPKADSYYEDQLMGKGIFNRCSTLCNISTCAVYLNDISLILLSYLLGYVT